MAQAQLLYIATQHGVTILSNPGRTDRWLSIGQELSDEHILRVHSEPDNPMQATVWTETQLYSSADGGQSWQKQQVDAIPEASISYKFPGNPEAHVHIQNNQLIRSEDGTTWAAINPDTNGSWSVLHGVSYHQDSVYAATNNGEVWVSTDRGATWQLIKRDLPPIYDLAIGRVIS